MLLGSPHYTKGVDIWALGCIIGELTRGKALFPGNSTLHQMDLVVQVLGMPSQAEVDSFHSPYAKPMLANLEKLDLSRRARGRSSSHHKSLEELLAGKAEEVHLDIIRRCFAYNPHMRISSEEVLAHDYVSHFHVPSGTLYIQTKIKILVQKVSQTLRKQHAFCVYFSYFVLVEFMFFILSTEEWECKHQITIPLDDFNRLSTKQYRERLYEEIPVWKNNLRQFLFKKKAHEFAPNIIGAGARSPAPKLVLPRVEGALGFSKKNY